METKNLIPLLAMPALMLAVEIGAILLSLPVKASGVVAFEDPASMENPVIFIGILLGFTAILLLLIKYGKMDWITWIIRLSFFATFCYIFTAIVRAAVPASLFTDILILVLSLAASVILFSYPEWYIVDSFGILIGAGVAAIFGASLEVLPVIILLAALAVYDAISVYKTKHMITLAEGVVDLKTPILFVIPKRRNYSFIREGIGKLQQEKDDLLAVPEKESTESRGDRAAFIIGMGDMIMPAILVVSANVFLQGWKLFGYVNLPSLGAIIGSVLGLCVLLHFVMSGKPQAGLPPINGGAILGFLAGYAAMMWMG